MVKVMKKKTKKKMKVPTLKPPYLKGMRVGHNISKQHSNDPTPVVSLQK